ncbi:MAG: biotin/lipoyl-containing protein, partial [Janthinobacterium lividum]
ARELALEAGVPVVSRGEDAGYPMMVKAAAGGGGKGMRLVRHAEDLDAALEAARREAAAAFGDDTMLVEKYVESGRHVEVQVMGDEHGTVLHLGERDCSTQRRHQKVLEEAPAPTLDEQTRTAIRSAAVALAAHVGYTGAGTVEFLLDNQTGDFYFLEMNTRLQVEHPVTEAVTGLDLVALQLRVAAGEPLGLTQDEVALSGHAIEARVYAEDAFGGFLPQAGTASFVRWPAATGSSTSTSTSTSTSVRVDQALESGQVVSTSFDPMLGKVIGFGPDRESARRALVSALGETVVLGLTTNVGFLRALLESREFRGASLDTAWLDTATVPAPDLEEALLLAAWTEANSGSPADEARPFRRDGWRIGGTRTAWRVRLDHETVLVEASALQHGEQRIDVRLVDHRVLGDRPKVHDVVLQLGPRRVAGTVVLHADAVEVVRQGQRYLLRRPVARGQGPATTSDGALLAAMPGTVLQVRCHEGETVAEGQVLAVLEAMKMEMSVRAPFDGVVTRVATTAGAQVQLGALLLQV